MDPETARLEKADGPNDGWKKWGPYISERQWGTVREDYSKEGGAWDYFTHDQARSRAYRWGEDGIAGICDDRQILCFALALWNGRATEGCLAAGKPGQATCPRRGATRDRRMDQLGARRVALESRSPSLCRGPRGYRGARRIARLDASARNVAS